MLSGWVDKGDELVVDGLLTVVEKKVYAYGDIYYTLRNDLIDGWKVSDGELRRIATRRKVSGQTAD